ncbi:MAG: hypothetical protein ACLS3M_10650 [Collinsella sp.]
MAKKKTKNQPKKKQVNAENVIGLHSEVTDQPITQTLEVNYMPYAMSVNVSRAFPRSTALSPRTASCSTPCTRWVCSRASARRAPTSWVRP